MNELVAQAHALRNQDPPMAWHKIGSQLGVTGDTVKCWLDPDYRDRRRRNDSASKKKRKERRQRERIIHGLPPRCKVGRSRKYSDEFVSKLVLARQDGASSSEIAERFGLSRNQTISILYRFGPRMPKKVAKPPEPPKPVEPRITLPKLKCMEVPVHLALARRVREIEISEGASTA